MLKKLYTEEEFQAARQAEIDKYGEDPCSDARWRKYGWRSSGYGAPRWWYSYPWRLTRPWLPRYYKGHDERCNKVLEIILPLLGSVSFYYESGPLRTWESPDRPECVAEIGFPSCPLDRDYHWPHCLPLEMTCPRCRITFPSTTGTFKRATDAGCDDDFKPFCSPECADR